MLGITSPVKKSIGDASNHCHARLHTCLKSQTILKHRGEHICKFDASEHQIRQFSQQVTARTCNTQETLDVIVTNCYKGEC